MRKKKPYDRTGTTEEALPVGAPQQEPMPVPRQMSVMQGVGGADAGGGGMDLGGMASLLGAAGGGAMAGGGGLDLGALGGAPDMGAALAPEGLAAPEEAIDEEELAVQDMIAAIEDPETPPEIREALQAQIALAARKRLGGVA